MPSARGLVSHPRRRSLKILLLVVGIVLVMAPGAFGLGFDLSRWKDVRLRFSSMELVFRVPAATSDSAPPLPPVPPVDLERDLSSAKPWKTVFTHSWDYKGWFWQGTLGSLRMTVDVSPRPTDYSKDLMSLDNLEELVRRTLEETLGKHNEKQIRDGQTEYLIVLPKSFTRATIHGREWLLYSIGGKHNDSAVYVTPLSGRHYVTIGFNFISNTHDPKTTWRQEAQALADQIAASLEIRNLQ